MDDFLDEKGKIMLKNYLIAKRKTYAELMKKEREKNYNNLNKNHDSQNIENYNKKKIR